MDLIQITDIGIPSIDLLVVIFLATPEASKLLAVSIFPARMTG